MRNVAVVVVKGITLEKLTIFYKILLATSQLRNILFSAWNKYQMEGKHISVEKEKENPLFAQSDGAYEQKSNDIPTTWGSSINSIKIRNMFFCIALCQCALLCVCVCFVRLKNWSKHQNKLDFKF